MIVVTAATGELGHRIVNQLLARVKPSQLGVVVRSPEKAQDFARQGIAVRQADYDDAAALTAAFQGAEKVIFIPGTAPTEPRNIQHANVIEAARRANVGQVIFISFVDYKAESPFPFSASYEFTEKKLRDSGLDWVILRSGLYADGILADADRILQAGVHVSSTGQGRATYISRDDIARAVAAAATSTAAGAGCSRQVYKMTGTAAFSQADLAALLSKVGGKPIAYQAVTHAAFADGLKQAGLPDFVISVVAGLNQAIEAGYYEEVSDDVRRLTGQAPESLEALLRRHVSQPGQA